MLACSVLLIVTDHNVTGFTLEILLSALGFWDNWTISIEREEELFAKARVLH